MNIKKIAHSNIFINFIIVIILINAALIGIQTMVDNVLIDVVQISILGIFIIEIFIRWLGKETAKVYFTNTWNWFDIAIVLLSLIPPDVFSDSSAVSALRVIRVFRVLRIFKAFPELQLMVKVLLKSFQSVIYAGVLLLIFMYIYSIMGVILFKGDTTVVTAHIDSIDPFDDIMEACFSLFRVSTSEDWTDLRYDLLNHKVKTSPLIINVYFLSWYVLSAFLLLNIITGAVINNYEIIYKNNKENEEEEEEKEEIAKKEKEDKELLEKIKNIESKIDFLVKNSK